MRTRECSYCLDDRDSNDITMATMPQKKQQQKQISHHLFNSRICSVWVAVSGLCNVQVKQIPSKYTHTKRENQQSPSLKSLWKMKRTNEKCNTRKNTHKITRTTAAKLSERKARKDMAKTERWEWACGKKIARVSQSKNVCTTVKKRRNGATPYMN